MALRRSAAAGSAPGPEQPRSARNAALPRCLSSSRTGRWWCAGEEPPPAGINGCPSSQAAWSPPRTTAASPSPARVPRAMPRRIPAHHRLNQEVTSRPGRCRTERWRVLLRFRDPQHLADGLSRSSARRRCAHRRVRPGREELIDRHQQGVFDMTWINAAAPSGFSLRGRGMPAATEMTPVGGTCGLSR